MRDLTFDEQFNQKKLKPTEVIRYKNNKPVVVNMDETYQTRLKELKSQSKKLNQLLESKFQENNLPFSTKKTHNKALRLTIKLRPEFANSRLSPQKKSTQRLQTATDEVVFYIHLTNKNEIDRFRIAAERMIGYYFSNSFYNRNQEEETKKELTKILQLESQQEQKEKTTDIIIELLKHSHYTAKLSQPLYVKNLEDAKKLFHEKSFLYDDARLIKNLVKMTIESLLKNLVLNPNKLPLPELKKKVKETLDEFLELEISPLLNTKIPRKLINFFRKNKSDLIKHYLKVFTDLYKPTYLKEKEQNTKKIIKQKFTSKFENESAFNFNDFFQNLFKELPNLEFYLVGGMTRDVLIDKADKAKDYDFVARNIPVKKLISILKKFGPVDLVGKNFGVLKFKPHDSKLSEFIDIALPRKEFSADTGGYRDVEAQADEKLSIKEDLSRRDLTINAMAWDIKNQKLIDPFNGQKDLKNKIIKTVGSPEKRFQEDYSRMLRAIRFACRFNFKFNKATWEKIKTMAVKINSLNKEGERIVPLEIISEEILKSLTANPNKALRLLDRTGLLTEIIPKIKNLKNCEQPPEFHSEGTVWQHTVLMFKNLKTKKFKEEFPKFKNDPIFLLAVLLHDIGKPATKQTPEKDGVDRIRFNNHEKTSEKIAQRIAEQFKLTNKQTKKLLFLIKNHMKGMGDISKMRNTTIEKDFFKEYGNDLLKLLYLDCASSIREDGQPGLENYYLLKDRINKFKALKKEQDSLPAELLNGKEIMQVLGLKKGKPIIGKLKKEIRELQLSGKLTTKEEALDYLKK